jgi:hypothetical protein
MVWTHFKNEQREYSQESFRHENKRKTLIREIEIMMGTKG